MSSDMRLRDAERGELDHQSGPKIAKDVATGLGLSIAVATGVHFLAPEESPQIDKPAPKIQMDSAQAIQQLLKDNAEIPPFDPTKLATSEDETQ